MISFISFHPLMNLWMKYQYKKAYKNSGLLYILADYMFCYEFKFFIQHISKSQFKCFERLSIKKVDKYISGILIVSLSQHPRIYYQTILDHTVSIWWETKFVKKTRKWRVIKGKLIFRTIFIQLCRHEVSYYCDWYMYGTITNRTFTAFNIIFFDNFIIFWQSFVPKSVRG